MKRINFLTHVLLWSVISALILPAIVTAQSDTSFSYQGRLHHEGEYVTGACNFQFSLFDAASGGNQLGTTITKNNVAVSNGYFTVILDFGNMFSGAARYLQIDQVNCELPGDPVNLSGRVEIRPAPYTTYATTAEKVESIDWNKILNIPAGFADNVDNGLVTICANSQTLRWFSGSWICVSALSDHNGFAGLADDDHPFYFRVDGTRPLGGNLDMNNQQLLGLAQATANGQAVTYEQTIKKGDAAGGDLSGAFPAPTVDRLQGDPVSASAPSLNQVLTWQNNQWTPADPRAGGPAGGDLTGSFPNPTVTKIRGKDITTTAPATGQVLRWDNANGYWEPANVIKRNDTAGGDLSGTYPNPTVTKLQGKTVSSTAPNDKQVLSWSGSQWYPSAPQIIGPAGGDLSGSHPSPTVAKIQGRAVANSDVIENNKVLTWNGLQWVPDKIISLQTRTVSPQAPEANQVLIWNGSQWEPAFVNTLQGRTVPNLNPTEGQALQWDNGSSRWVPGDVIKPGDTAGGHLTGTYPNPEIADNAVGMTQLNLPMGYASGSNNMANGAELYVIPNNAGFTPTTEGTCLVAVNAYIKSNGGTANDDPNPELRTAKSVNNVPQKDTGGFGIRFSADDVDANMPSGASANFVWNIATSDLNLPVKFGCHVTDGVGDFDQDETVYCRVMFICQ